MSGRAAKRHTFLLLVLAAMVVLGGKPASHQETKAGNHRANTTPQSQIWLLGAPLLFGPGVNSPGLAPPIAASCPRFPILNVPGVLCEDFDTDRNATTGFQWSRLPIGVDPVDPLTALGDPNDDVLGYTQHTGTAPAGTDAEECLGDIPYNQPTCTAPVAEENDWHLHSPTEGPGQGYDPPNRPGIGAPDGGKAHSGTRSMHLGRHTRTTSPSWDTTRFRQVAAFVLDPPVVPGPVSTMQFWQIIQLPDDDSFGFVQPGTTLGGGQVQISVMDPNGLYGKWQRLTPTFNGYNSVTQESITVCEFDPGDDELIPNDETMCDASPMWSDMGDIFGTDATCQTDTDFNDPVDKDCGEISSCTGGPGCTENGSIGVGVWAKSAFDLSPFAGQRARLRWIGSMGGGWSFGISRSFLEPAGGPYPPLVYEADDGWWIDDIVLTDLREGPFDCAEDSDTDTYGICTDCDDTDATIWTRPGEAIDLLFTDEQTLSWAAPAAPGAILVVYDTVRTADPADFNTAAVCVETDDGPDTFATDAATPSVDGVFFYLVRAENDCPGGDGPVGTGSDGTPRTARACP